MIGRVQRQCRRLSRIRAEVTTSELVAWCYPRLKPEQLKAWHKYNARRAAERYWERAGRALVNGRWQCLWRPKA